MLSALYPLENWQYCQSARNGPRIENIPGSKARHFDERIIVKDCHYRQFCRWWRLAILPAERQSAHSSRTTTLEVLSIIQILVVHTLIPVQQNSAGRTKYGQFQISIPRRKILSPLIGP